MDERTLTALQGSIAKWEHVVNGTGPESGADNCPLCDMFGPSCPGCPIHETTGNGCQNDQWHNWCDHVEMHMGDIDINDEDCLDFYVQCPECVRLAQAELDFLRSLLPEEGKQ